MQIASFDLVFYRNIARKVASGMSKNTSGISKKCVAALQQSLQKVEPDYILLRVMLFATKMLRDFMTATHACYTTDSSTCNCCALCIIGFTLQFRMDLCRNKIARLHCVIVS